MKTRDRILLMSLKMFNEQGERSVTTNHIAAALNMSPGNLYYYFKNKEAIIFELFCHYELRTRAYLRADPDQQLTWSDILRYFKEIARNIWDYRFLHRDLEQLLAHNPQLLAQYRLFAQDVMSSGRHIMQLMNSSGLLQANDDELDALIINTWVIATGWAPFLHATAVFGPLGTELTQAMIHRGIRQILYLLKPYLSQDALNALPELLEYYNKIS